MGGHGEGLENREVEAFGGGVRTLGKVEALAHPEEGGAEAVQAGEEEGRGGYEPRLEN